MVNGRFAVTDGRFWSPEDWPFSWSDGVSSRLIGSMNSVRPPTALPERFNWLESMLFSAEVGNARRAAERYVGELLARPVSPPRHRRPATT